MRPTVQVPPKSNIDEIDMSCHGLKKYSDKSEPADLSKGDRLVPQAVSYTHLTLPTNREV